MTRGVGLGAGAAADEVDDKAEGLAVFGVGDGDALGGCFFVAWVLATGVGEGLACAAGVPAGAGLLALKLFQFTQPVRATAATRMAGL